MIATLVVLQVVCAGFFAYVASSDARYEWVLGSYSRWQARVTKRLEFPGANIPHETFRRWERLAAAIGAVGLVLMALATIW